MLSDATSIPELSAPVAKKDGVASTLQVNNTWERLPCLGTGGVCLPYTDLALWRVSAQR